MTRSITQSEQGGGGTSRMDTYPSLRRKQLLQPYFDDELSEETMSLLKILFLAET